MPAPPLPLQAIFLATFMEVLRDHGVDAAAESLQAAKSGLVLPWLKQQLPNLSGTLAALQGADHPKLAALEQTLVEHFSGPAAAAGGDVGGGKCHGLAARIKDGCAGVMCGVSNVAQLAAHSTGWSRQCCIGGWVWCCVAGCNLDCINSRLEKKCECHPLQMGRLWPALTLNRCSCSSRRWRGGCGSCHHLHQPARQRGPHHAPPAESLSAVPGAGVCGPGPGQQEEGPGGQGWAGHSTDGPCICVPYHHHYAADQS
jgi:hypothetical protein